MSEKIKLALKSRPETTESDLDVEAPGDRMLLPFGSTMLNLACSDTPFGAIRCGRIVQIFSGTHAGKTILAMSGEAEASILPEFDEYDLIDDDVEHADDFDVSKIFGKRLAKRIQSPRIVDDEPINSDTIDDFKDNILRRLKSKTPFVYVLDSVDSLTDNSEIKKAEEDLKARDKARKAGEDTEDSAGSYNMIRQKKMSENLRMVKKKLWDAKSPLILISQVRDKVGAQRFQEKESPGGGRSIEFYCSHRIKLKVIEHIKSSVYENLEIGVKVNAEVIKNKLTGKRRSATFCIYYDYGIDDVGSMVDFIIDNDHWKPAKAKAASEDEDTGRKKKAGGKVVAHELCDTPMYRKELANFIRENGLRRRVQKIAGKVWAAREEAISLKWKSLYD